MQRGQKEFGEFGVLVGDVTVKCEVLFVSRVVLSIKCFADGHAAHLPGLKLVTKPLNCRGRFAILEKLLSDIAGHEYTILCG